MSTGFNMVFKLDVHLLFIPLDTFKMTGSSHNESRLFSGSSRDVSNFVFLLLFVGILVAVY